MAGEPTWINEALWYRSFGPPSETLDLEQAEVGPRAEGKIRVRMISAPINPSDLIPITGAYSHRVQPPQVAGYEGVGVVVEADAPTVALMDHRVLPLRGPGVWQRFVDCDPSWLVAVPDDVPTILAARSYINPLAALLMLEGWPVAGKRVLLTAGGSTCGRLLGQWAIGAGAREVVSVCRSRDHARSLADLGLIPLCMDDPAAIQIAASRADVAFDAVGGQLAEALLAGMSCASDFVSYGLLSGRSFRPSPLGPPPQRFHLRDRLATVQPPEWRGWFQQLWPLLRQASMPDARHFPLSDWREALTAFDAPGRGFKPMLIFD